MRILHVIPSLEKGGAERICIDICNELVKNNHTVMLVLLSNIIEYNHLHSKVKLKVVNSFVKFRFLRRPICRTSEFDSLVNSFKPDIIHSHLYGAETIARWNYNKSIKYLSHIHSNQKELIDRKISSLRTKADFINLYERFRILKLYSKCKNTFISISEDCTDFYKKNIPFLKDSVVELKNAIDYNRFKNNNTPSISNKVKLISVGSLNIRKNQILQIKIAHLLKQSNVPFHLTIIGEGPERKKLEEAINKLNLNKEVTLIGLIENVELYLKSSNIFLHTAKYEPFGLVILEAMAAGLTVLSLDGIGNRSILKNKLNGYLLKQSSKPESFVDLIKELTENTTLYRKITNNGIETAKNHDIKNYAEKLVKIYCS